MNFAALFDIHHVEIFVEKVFNQKILYGTEDIVGLLFVLLS